MTQHRHIEVQFHCLETKKTHTKIFRLLLNITVSTSLPPSLALLGGKQIVVARAIFAPPPFPIVRETVLIKHIEL